MNTPTYSRWGVDVYHGDCLDVLSTLADDSVDSVVTDPPYALEFMGKTWDKYTPASYQAWCEKWATECLRVLKLGGHLLAFGGTRTAHRLTCGIEDAGFELRDTITWCYSSGFPKSRDISKDIDKAAGVEREVLGEKLSPDGVPYSKLHGSRSGRQAGIQGNIVPVSRNSELLTAAATEAAKQWDGWGTALKPASEPIIVARKPFKGTVAANVLAHGTGGINIDGCRVQTTGAVDAAEYAAKCASVVGLESNRNGAAYGEWSGVRTDSAHVEGRWPSNLVLSHASTVDGEDSCADGCVQGCPVAELDAQSGTLSSWMAKTNYTVPPSNEIYGKYTAQPVGPQNQYGDSGGASRFYPVFRYQAKAPKRERPLFDGRAHATVKSLALMRWLVRLVTPPGGLVLDPLCGTGTTGQACRAEGFKAILIEKEAEYLPLIKARLNALPKTESGAPSPDENAPQDLFDLLSGDAS